jgi:hypothetical protein
LVSVDLEQALAKGLEKVCRGSEIPPKQAAPADASIEELLQRISQLEAELKKN